jgi:hypothetical protein
MQMVMDTHRMVKRLKEAGFTDIQAEVVTDVLRDARETDRDDLVTKGFLRSELAEIKSEMIAVKSDLRAEIQNLKADLFKWLLPILIGQVAATAALVKLL